MPRIHYTYCQPPQAGYGNSSDKVFYGEHRYGFAVSTVLLNKAPSCTIMMYHFTCPTCLLSTMAIVGSPGDSGVILSVTECHRVFL